MATTLYFHQTTSPTYNGTLPATSQSGLTFGGSGGDAVSVNRYMSPVIGTIQTSITKTTATSTSPTSYFFTKFVSPPLLTTSISSGTWTFQFSAAESSTSANFPVSGSGSINVTCYVWRPSANNLIGTIINSATGASTYTEPSSGGTNTAETGTFTGQAVTCNVGDVIVLEVIFTTSQANTTSRTDTFNYDGNTQGSTSSNAAFLSTTQTLKFQYQTALATEALGTITDAIKKRMLRDPVEPLVSVSEHLSVTQFVSIFDHIAKKAWRKLPTIPETLTFGADAIAVLKNPGAKHNVISLTTEALGSITETIADHEKYIRAVSSQAVGTITDPIKRRISRHPMYEGLGFILDSSASKVKRIPPTLSEALGAVVETANKAARRKKTEALGAIADSMKKIRAPPAFADVLSISATDLLKKISRHTPIVEALGAVGQTTSKFIPKLFSQTVGSITESQIKKIALHILPEPFVLLEALWKRAWRKLVTDALGTVGQTSFKLVMPKALSQAIGSITDSPTKKKAVHLLSELLGILELLQRKQFKKSSLGDTIIIGADSVQKTHRFLRALVQVVKTTISGTGS
jgi:hypothetical protein